jgi:hypothetical protein
MMALSPEQARALLIAAIEKPIHTLLMVSLGTGRRQG